MTCDRSTGTKAEHDRTRPKAGEIFPNWTKATTPYNAGTVAAQPTTDDNHSTQGKALNPIESKRLIYASNKRIGNSRERTNTMDKVILKIREKIEALTAEYAGKRKQYTDKLTAAKDDLAKARAALEAAEDMESYDMATATVTRAELGVTFAQKALNKFDAIPRMTDTEYNQIVATCRATMQKAANGYREEAFQLMDRLKEIHDEYLQTARELNETMVALDKATNKRTEHPVRFDGGEPCRIATKASGNEPGYKESDVWNSVLASAWSAISRAYPEKTY